MKKYRLDPYSGKVIVSEMREVTLLKLSLKELKFGIDGRHGNFVKVGSEQKLELFIELLKRYKPEVFGSLGGTYKVVTNGYHQVKSVSYNDIPVDLDVIFSKLQDAINRLGL